MGKDGPVFVLAAGLIAVHVLFRPLLAEWTAAPDLLTGGLLLAALRIRPGYAALLGFVVGALEGALALTGIGAYALLFTTVGFLAARSRDLLFADARFFVFFYLFAGVWLVQIALALLPGPSPGAWAVLGIAVARGAVTALVCGVLERLAVLATA